MYPRNASNPERLAIGAVIQISDGAVQTSDVSIKVKPQGGSASAGGGTVSYEEGIVGYIPTQAETNCTSFQVIAYKTGCIPASVTVVTTASVTPGTVVPAADSITASVFDESTAFPLKYADTGATQVARVDAVFDELLSGHTIPGSAGKTLSDIYARIEDQVEDGPVIVLPAPEIASQTVAWCVCYDQNGDVEEGARVFVRIKSGGSQAGAYDSRPAVGVSNADGVASVIVPRDASLVFEAKRGGGAWVTFSGAATETLELPAIIGMP